MYIDSYTYYILSLIQKRMYVKCKLEDTKIESYSSTETWSNNLKDIKILGGRMPDLEIHFDLNFASTPIQV